MKSILCILQHIKTKLLTPRWDCSTDAEEYLIDAVRDQHRTRATDFLVSELQISESEAMRRIFFVSAKDIFDDFSNQSRSRISREILAEWSR